jgi:hypothetical protein
MKRKVLVGAIAGMALLIASSSAAFAQDCFIISRSDRGSQQAGSHSSVWGAFALHDLLTAPVDPNDEENSGLGCSDDAADAIVAQVKALGLPTVLSTRIDTVIGENSSNPNLGDGKGLEHFGESPYFNTVFETAVAYEQANPGSCTALA